MELNKKVSIINKEQIQLIIALSLAIFSPNYSQFQMSPISAEIIAHYHFTTPQFVSLFTAPMMTAIFLSVISGSIVDRLGYRWVIFISLFISLIGTVARIFVSSYVAFFISMIGIGFSATFINANLAKILGIWFDRSKFQVMLGGILAVSTVAMTIALGTTAFFNSTTLAFECAALINLVAVIAWPILMREKQGVNTHQNEEKLGKMMIRVIRFKPMWLIGLSLFCVMGGYMTMSSFLPMIMSEKGYTNEMAGVMSSLLTFGNLVGCLIMPAIIGRLNRRRLSIGIMAFIVALLSIWFTLWNSSVILGAILLIMGIIIGGLIPTFMSLPMMFSRIGQKYSGTAGGFIGMLQLMGAVIFPSYVIAPLTLSANQFFYAVSIIFILVIASMVTIPFSEIE